MPGPDPQPHSEAWVTELGERRERWESWVATGLCFEKSCPRNKCVQDVFPLPEDFRAFLWLGRGPGLHQNKTSSLESQCLADFCYIVRWQRTQHSKSLVPVSQGCISAEQNQPELELALEQTSRIFCFYLSHQGLLKMRADLLSPPLSAHCKAHLPQAAKADRVMWMAMGVWKLWDVLSRHGWFGSIGIFFWRRAYYEKLLYSNCLNYSIPLKNVGVLILYKKYKTHCGALQWHQGIKNKVIWEAGELVCLSPAKSLTSSWIQQLCS